MELEEAVEVDWAGFEGALAEIAAISIDKVVFCEVVRVSSSALRSRSRSSEG